MTNEKDYSVAAGVVDEFNLTDCRCDGIVLTNGAIANLTRRIANAFATVRAEEREAAFKEAAGIARAMASGETFETGRQKALNIAAALEAAAENRKGEG